MHDHEWDKTTWIKFVAKCMTNISQQCVLYCGCLLRKRQRACRLPARPCPAAALRQGIIVNHRSCQTGGIFFEVINNVFTNSRPSTDTAATVPLSCIAHETGANL